MNQPLPRDSGRSSSDQRPAATSPRRLGWTAVLVVCVALCVFVVYRPFFVSHFDATVSDLADGRFELTLLEHWTKIFHGQGHVSSPNFFYPVKGVLGFSDAFLGLAIPHAVFRSLGADRYLAVQFATMLFTVLGFAGMYLLLRGPLRFTRPPALLGASLFVISNMYYIYVVHPYILVSVMIAPAVFLLAARYWQDKDSRQTKARIWLVLCAILLALILYTSYYIGWFLIFCSAALWMIYVMCRIYADRDTQPLRQVLKTVKAQQWNLLLGGAVLVVALVPFLLLYLPSLQRNGKRSVADSLPYLQPPLGVLDVGRDNLVWGPLSARIQNFNSPGGILEHPTGWPLLTICLFLIAAMYCFVRLGRSRDQCDASDKETLCLMSAIGITCIVLWPVGIRIGQHSPAWAVLLKLVPGAGAIRLPQRIHLVLNIGVVIVCMFGFEKLRKALAGRGVLAYLVPALLACALLTEQLNFMPTHAISRAEEAQKFSRISAPPSGCTVFYVSTWRDDHFGKLVLQTDGMMVAQQYGIPTLNGTSSWFPDGWSLADAAQGHVTEQAFTWALAHGISQGLCALDMNSGLWSKKDLSHFNPVADLGPTVAGKLVDPGFEDDDLAVWLPFQQVHATVSTAQSHSGAHSLAETGGVGSVYQDAMGLEPGRTYRISAWASSSPDATAVAQIAAWNSATNVSTFSNGSHPQGTWQFLSTFATADPAGTMRIHLFRLEGSGTIYWDDVSIHSQQEAPQVTPPQ